VTVFGVLIERTQC